MADKSSTPKSSPKPQPKPQSSGRAIPLSESKGTGPRGPQSPKGKK